MLFARWSDLWLKRSVTLISLSRGWSSALKKEWSRSLKGLVGRTSPYQKIRSRGNKVQPRCQASLQNNYRRALANQETLLHQSLAQAYKTYRAVSTQESKSRKRSNQPQPKRKSKRLNKHNPSSKSITMLLVSRHPNLRKPQSVWFSTRIS